MCFYFKNPVHFFVQLVYPPLTINIDIIVLITLPPLFTSFVAYLRCYVIKTAFVSLAASSHCVLCKLGGGRYVKTQLLCILFIMIWTLM